MLSDRIIPRKHLHNLNLPFQENYHFFKISIII